MEGYAYECYMLYNLLLVEGYAFECFLFQGTLILKFQSLPNSHKLLYTSIDALELFSCNLDNEDESALSILDPVTITMEIKPPNDRVSPRTKGEGKFSAKGSAKGDEAEEGTMQPFEVFLLFLNKF